MAETNEAANLNTKNGNFICGVVEGKAKETEIFSTHLSCAISFVRFEDTRYRVQHTRSLFFITLTLVRACAGIRDIFFNFFYFQAFTAGHGQPSNERISSRSKYLPFLGVKGNIPANISSF